MNLLFSRTRLLGNREIGFRTDYIGYLLISGLCDLCKICLNEENARYFIGNCMDSLNLILSNNVVRKDFLIYLRTTDSLVESFINFAKSVEKKYEIQRYIKSMLDYNNEYGTGKPSDVVVNLNMIDIIHDWRNIETNIYIPNGILGNFPSGLLIIKKLYEFGNEFEEDTGGWEFGNISTIFQSGVAQKMQDCMYFNSIDSEIEKITLTCPKNVIDISKYSKIGAKIKTINYYKNLSAGLSIGITDEKFNVGHWIKIEEHGNKIDLEPTDIYVDIKDVNEGFIQFGTYRGEGYLYSVWLHID